MNVTGLQEQLGGQGGLKERLLADQKMATNGKTITFPTQESQWVKQRMASGAYTPGRDQQRNTTLQALRGAIQEGLTGSGVSDRTVAEIWEEAEHRSRAKDG